MNRHVPIREKDHYIGALGLSETATRIGFEPPQSAAEGTTGATPDKEALHTHKLSHSFE